MTTISSLGIATNSYTNNFKNRKTANSVPKEINKEPQNVKKRNKIKAFIVSTLALAAGIGILVISKGKSAQKKKLLTEIPEDLQVRFAKLKDLDGNEFIDKAYTELVEHMNLKGIAPKKIGKLGSDNPFSISGGYNPIEHTIKYTDGFFTKLSKPEQINLLSHELKHCEQFTNMLRTESIGLEKYTEAAVEATINSAKKDPLNIQFSLAYNRAKSAGKEEEFLKNIREIWYKDIMEMIKSNYKEILKMPKIKADSPEGIKAVKDLEARKNYEGLGFLGIGGEKYKNNPLEVEAYAYGDKMEQLLKKYLQIVS